MFRPVGWLMMLMGFLAVELHAASPPQSTVFECRFICDSVTIDGKAEEPGWKQAQIIDQFSLPWLKEQARPARTSTEARLMWDREYLYFFAEMQDADLYADVTEPDGETWLNDVFELFFKPAADKPGYYEFQVNAAGTTMDMFLPRRGSGGYRRFIKDQEFHLEAKVVRRGTLNNWTDKDEGWSVEGRIPWRDFVRTGGRPGVNEEWRFALCRYDYSIDFEGPELSTCAPLSSLPEPNFHHHEDYATVRFIGPTQPPGRVTSQVMVHPLDRLKAEFRNVPSRVMGSPEPPPPYRVARVLPKLKLNFPIVVANEPGSRRLLLVDQMKPYGPSRLARTADDPESGEFTTLLEFEGGAVAYSIAFHPDFAHNGFVYLGMNGSNSDDKKVVRIVRYTIGRTEPFAFDPQSAKVIIEWASNGHNGAGIAFGRDGMLYVTSGDGTSDSDTDIAGQRLDHLLSKVLRIDVDHPDQGRAYSVPKDNPFVGVPDARTETFAYGFRNPWRLHIDPRTDHIWVGNNGQDLWEQVYLVERGANYGWSVYEGGHLFYANRKLGPTPVSKPLFDHPHSEARSLTGGVVYYGRKLPELFGAYLYGDHSTGKIWGAKVEGRHVVWHKELADSTLQITSFALDAEGELLISDHRGNQAGGLYTLEKNPAENSNQDFPHWLSQSGLFQSVAEHRPHPGLIPYSVNAELWSDGAYKERFLYLASQTDGDGQPEPFHIKLGSNRGWNLPERSVLVKSFALETQEGEPSSRRWIETRFLTRQEGEWVGYSYRWKEDQTDAELVAKDGLDQTFSIRQTDGRTRQLAWRYPSRTECMVCHSRAANYVLGASTLQMNKEHDYGGVIAHQFDVLEWLGLFEVDWAAELKAVLREELKYGRLNAEKLAIRVKNEGKSGEAAQDQELSDSELDKLIQQLTASRGQRSGVKSALLFQTPEKMKHLVDPYDPVQPLAARVRSYLHANCAHCHVEAGGGNAQMQLEFATASEKMNVIGVSPLHHRFDIPDAQLVVPGEPERSVLLMRISRRGPGSGQMPQLATTRVDVRAVQLLKEWIQSIPPR